MKLLLDSHIPGAVASVIADSHLDLPGFEPGQDPFERDWEDEHGAASIKKLCQQLLCALASALARKAGTSQSVVARIEAGLTSPTWDTLERLLEAVGFEVSAQVEPRVVVGSHMLDDVPRILLMTPEQRLDEVKNLTEFLHQARRV